MPDVAAHLAVQGEILDKKKTKQTDQMMRSILMHANTMWREQRSTHAKVLDPKNNSKMKKKTWGGSHDLGWSHDEMDWFSKTVRNKQGLGQFCEHS